LNRSKQNGDLNSELISYKDVLGSRDMEILKLKDEGSHKEGMNYDLRNQLNSTEKEVIY
jgi:hypothetical protein